MSVTNSHNRGDDAATQLHAQRCAAMAIVAQATPDELARGLKVASDGVDFTDLRPPEIGLVMLRGRIGGAGAPFNIGEASVTRAAVRLSSGETGFGYVLGRDREKARLAALCDALWQNDARRQLVEDQLLTPLRREQDMRRAFAREQTAATRVDFFTLVRGDDE